MQKLFRMCIFIYTQICNEYASPNYVFAKLGESHRDASIFKGVKSTTKYWKEHPLVECIGSIICPKSSWIQIRLTNVFFFKKLEYRNGIIFQVSSLCKTNHAKFSNGFSGLDNTESLYPLSHTLKWLEWSTSFVTKHRVDQSANLHCSKQVSICNYQRNPFHEEIRKKEKTDN